MEAPAYLPNDLSEANFRRYEPLIALGVREFPKETQFKIFPNIAPTTFVARFRSAIVSLKKFNWESTTVDTLKLKEINGLYSISRDFSDGTVWFRVKHRAGRPTEFKEESRRAPVTPRWENVAVEELGCLCKLISSNRLSGPYEIVGKFPEDLVLSLQVTNNVGIVYHDAEGITVVT